MYNPKVLVVVPAGGKIGDECWKSWYALNYNPIGYLIGRTGEVMEKPDESWTPDKKWKWIDDRFIVIANARNQILEMAMKIPDWEYLLWIDSDIEVYPELLNEMLKYTPDEKIITAKYDYKNIPTEEIDEETKKKYKITDYKLWCGFGCILVAREVHEKVGPFIGKWDRKGWSGEDVIYCIKIREAEFRILCPPEIKVKHHFIQTAKGLETWRRIKGDNPLP